MVYYNIERDWIRTKEPWHQEGSQAMQRRVEVGSSAESFSMLQRWQEETMRDQPYNCIEAVAKMDDGNKATDNATAQNQGSSVHYFGPANQSMSVRK